METQMKVAVVVMISSIIAAIILGPIVISSNGTEDTVNDTVNDTVIHFPLEIANNSINLNVVQEQHNKNVITIPERDDIRRIIDLEFSDYFSDDSSNWGTYSDDEECKRYIEDGKLKFDKISEKSDVLFYSALEGYTPPENFIVEFNATIERNRHDGQIGIYFRKIDYDNFYRFLISREGEYRFDKEENGHMSVIIPWTNSSSIKEGTETNTIKVKCEGNTITFYINGVEINSCADSSFANGDIVLVAGVGDNSLNTNKFSFDNFKIWSIKY
jgi:hypothetical protein